jgi:hypothetical protein
VRARDIYVRTVRDSRTRAGYLLLLGVIVFVPLGLLDALANRVNEIYAESPDQVFDLATAALLLGLLAQAVTTLLGEVFYAGAVALTMRQGEYSPPPSLRDVARRLSYGRLIAVDILLALLVAAGLVLLIVPGLLFFGWFALAGPVVEIEERGVRAAFARSRQLVRGSLWTVLLVLIPITIASALLGDALVELPHLVIHEPLLSDWASESLSNILLSPFYAVAAVLMTLELAVAKDGVLARDRVAGSRKPPEGGAVETETPGTEPAQPDETPDTGEGGGEGGDGGQESGGEEGGGQETGQEQ